jgi:hypothetical protein
MLIEQQQQQQQPRCFIDVRVYTHVRAHACMHAMARALPCLSMHVFRICVEHGCWKRGAYRILFLRGTSHPSSLGGDVHFRAWRHIVEDTNLGFGVLKASANGNT